MADTLMADTLMAHAVMADTLMAHAVMAQLKTRLDGKNPKLLTAPTSTRCATHYNSEQIHYGFSNTFIPSWF